MEQDAAHARGHRGTAQARSRGTARLSAHRFSASGRSEGIRRLSYQCVTITFIRLVERIAEAFLLPTLELVLEAFPFVIRG